MDLNAMMSQMLLLFFTLAVGFFAAKIKIMNEDTNRFLSELVVCILNPLQILASVMTPQRLLRNGQVLALSLIAFLCYIAAILIALPLTRCLRTPKKQVGILRFMFIFSNTGFIGYPLAGALFGESATFYVTVFVLMFQLFCWTYGVFLVEDGTGRFRPSLSLLKNPCVIAALIAYVIYFSGLRVPSVIGDMTRYVGQLTPPVSMLIIGCALAQMKLWRVFDQWRLYVLCAVKLLLFPACVWAILRCVVNNELMVAITVLLISMPVATNSTIISYRCGGDQETASAGIFLSTLLSLGTLPLLMYLLF